MKYQWYKNGVAVSGNEGKADSLLVESDADATEGQNIDIMLVGRKDYSGNNTCYDSSWVTVTSAYVGIDEAEAVAVAVYPNPAARLLSVSRRAMRRPAKCSSTSARCPPESTPCVSPRPPARPPAN